METDFTIKRMLFTKLKPHLLCLYIIALDCLDYLVGQTTLLELQCNICRQSSIILKSRIRYWIKNHLK